MGEAAVAPRIVEVLKPNWRMTASRISIHFRNDQIQKPTYEIGLSQGRGCKNIASFVGICTTVGTDCNNRGVRVLAVGTLDIPCGTFAVNYKR